MSLLAFKALHIIGFVAWFAGVFYLIRLFVYHAEAFSRPEAEKQVLTAQYAIMEKRLFSIITRPAMLITFVGGIAMLIIHPVYLQEGWMHVKLLLVILLAGYTDMSKLVMKKLAKGEMPMTPQRFRLYNEIPTLFLVAIVLLAIFRSSLSLVTLLLIIVGLVVVLGAATYLYARHRKRKSNIGRST